MTVEVEYKGIKKIYKKVPQERAELARKAYEQLFGCGAIKVKILKDRDRPP